MSLSAFAQYYLRKLLHKHLDSFGGLLSTDCQNNLPLVDVNQLLNQFYAQTHSSTALHREMEIWLQIHQDLEHSPRENRQHAEEVERRILGLLGLRLGQVARHLQPLIEVEQSCVRFRFLHNGRICEGMRQGLEIYGLVYQFQKNSRFWTYQLTCALLEREIPCLMTTSTNRCAVWVPLRSPAYSILVEMSPTFLRCLTMLHVHPHKWRGEREQQGRATCETEVLPLDQAAHPSTSHPDSIAMAAIGLDGARKPFGRIARHKVGEAFSKNIF
jgi:hypothetical protein